MKKSLLILPLLLMCFSCTSGPRKLFIGNSTDAEVQVRIFLSNGKNINKTVPKGNTFYEIPEESVVKIICLKDDKEDFEYNIFKYSDCFGYGVRHIAPITYTIKCLLPSDAFTGTESLILEYQQRTDRGKVVLGSDMIVQITSYDEPKLNRTMINDYPVSLCRQDNQLIIY